MFKKIYLEIINYCNLNCPFCVPSDKPKKMMSLGEIRHILPQIKSQTDYINLHVKGEPLMHPAFDKVLDLCQEAGLMVNITTNGLLLPKWEDALLHSKALRQINVSLQSLITQNEARRKDYLDYLVSFIRKAQGSSSFYMSLRLWNDCRKPDVSALNRMVISHLRQAFDITIPDDFDGFCLTDRIHLSKDEEFVWPQMDSPFNSDRGYCMGGKTHIGILADGTVVICCLDQNGVSNLGNVFESNLSDILGSERFQEIVKGFSERKAVLELCRKCTFRNRFM